MLDDMDITSTKLDLYLYFDSERYAVSSEATMRFQNYKVRALKTSFCVRIPLGLLSLSTTKSLRIFFDCII